MHSPSQFSKLLSLSIIFAQNIFALATVAITGVAAAPNAYAQLDGFLQGLSQLNKRQSTPSSTGTHDGYYYS